MNVLIERILQKVGWGTSSDKDTTSNNEDNFS